MQAATPQPLADNVAIAAVAVDAVAVDVAAVVVGGGRLFLTFGDTFSAALLTVPVKRVTWMFVLRTFD